MQPPYCCAHPPPPRRNSNTVENLCRQKRNRSDHHRQRTNTTPQPTPLTLSDFDDHHHHHVGNASRMVTFPIFHDFLIHVFLLVSFKMISFYFVHENESCKVLLLFLVVARERVESFVTKREWSFFSCENEEERTKRDKDELGKGKTQFTDFVSLSFVFFFLILFVVF